MKFAQYLTYLREKKGLEKIDLANKMGVTPGYYYNLENEQRKPPTSERCEQIATILALDEVEKKKLFELAYEGRIKNNDLAFEETLKTKSVPAKRIIEDEDILRRHLVADLLHWAQKVEIKKLKSLSEFIGI